MIDILAEYPALLRSATEAGARGTVLRRGNAGHFESDRHRKDFIRGCHRGFQKAQDRLIELLIRLQNEERGDKLEVEMYLRKIADTIAYQMLRGKSHVIRRYAYHDRPIHVAPNTLRSAQIEATRLNDESRLTFALIADLTTFIHLCDIIRIDHRTPGAAVHEIELKSGAVNSHLLEQLKDMPSTDQSVNDIDSDPAIAERLKTQAKRMLRQRIRIEQIKGILRTDSGFDPKHKETLVLSREEMVEDNYDRFLNRLLTRAFETGFAGGTVDQCLHIGVGNDHDRNKAESQAKNSLMNAIHSHWRSASESAYGVLEEVSRLVSPDQQFFALDLVYSNLRSVPCEPLTLWAIEREHLMRLISGSTRVMVSIDLASFVHLGRTLGLGTKLTSRKKATELAQRYGAQTIPRWNGRGLEHSINGIQFCVGSGNLSRFINDLVGPARFLEHMRDDLARGDFGN